MERGDGMSILIDDFLSADHGVDQRDKCSCCGDLTVVHELTEGRCSICTELLDKELNKE